MKKLKIYKADDFVIERVNEFGHSTKRFFITENGLLEGLDAYKPVMTDYQLEVSESLHGLVMNHLER